MMTDHHQHQGDIEERVRRRAHAIWEREGCPAGRAEEHWAAAREEIASEDSQGQATEPNPVAADGDGTGRSEPVEPLLAATNQGEVPGLTDQGEEQQYPRKRQRGGSQIDPGMPGAQPARRKAAPRSRTR